MLVGLAGQPLYGICMPLRVCQRLRRRRQQRRSYRARVRTSSLCDASCTSSLVRAGYQHSTTRGVADSDGDASLCYQTRSDGHGHTYLLLGIPSEALYGTHPRYATPCTHAHTHTHGKPPARAIELYRSAANHSEKALAWRGGRGVNGWMGEWVSG